MKTPSQPSKVSNIGTSDRTSFDRKLGASVETPTSDAVMGIEVTQQVTSGDLGGLVTRPRDANPLVMANHSHQIVGDGITRTIVGGVVNDDDFQKSLRVFSD